MKKLYILLTAILFISLVTTAYAQSESQPEVNVHYFYGTGCSHCAEVSASGVLERAEQISGVTLQKINVHSSQENRDLFNSMNERVGIPTGSRGWPFIVIEKDGEYSYLQGDVSIIANLEKAIKEDYTDDPENNEGLRALLTKLFIKELNQESGKLSPAGWAALIVVALIDSINPCAFGVLIFLMASLLKMGSPKRALRAGLIYSLIIFLVYFSIGLILYKTIDKLTSTSGFYYFYIILAAIIILLGLLQLKDVFWYGKGPTLRIPLKAKPVIESLMYKGTLPAIILLGILVAIFELPCTGEVYITIISIMANHKVFALSYFIVYNLVFILPLIILTYIVYKGTSTESLKLWTMKNRKWMKLASGILLILLATYIFISSIKFL